MAGGELCARNTRRARATRATRAHNALDARAQRAHTRGNILRHLRSGYGPLDLRAILMALYGGKLWVHVQKSAKLFG